MSKRGQVCSTAAKGIANALVAGAVALVVVWATVDPVQSAFALSPPASGHTSSQRAAAYGMLSRPREVRPGQLPPPAGGVHHPTQPPQLHPNPSAYQAAKQDTRPRPGGPRVLTPTSSSAATSPGTSTSSASASNASSATVEELLTDASLTSLGEQLGWFGQDQFLEPPDTHLSMAMKKSSRVASSMSSRMAR